jgi:outer membrane protein
VLFNGLANYANVSQSEDDLDAAKLDLQRLKQDIVLLTTDYFYNVIRAKALENVREENVKYNEKFLEQIQERNRLGSIPIADVYQQQVQLGNAELALIEAENNYQIALNTFLDYLALDVLKEYELLSPFEGQIDENLEQYIELFDEIDVMVQEAFENRYDYKSQQLVLSSAESGVTVANGGFWPRLTGSYSFRSSSTSFTDLLDFNRKVWGAGLTLSIPIFSNFNVMASSEFAKVQELNAREDLAVLERQIKIEIKQGYINLLASKKGVDVSTKNVRSAEENRRVLYERYNLGSGTILDVLQADRDFIDAQSNYITTLYAFYISRDRLMNFLGKLDSTIYE